MINGDAKPTLTTLNREIRAEKRTRLGRQLKKKIHQLNLKLVLYRKRGGKKPEISRKIYDLATEFEKEVVTVCHSQRDYHYVMVQTISLFSQRVAEYVHVNPERFSRYCSARKRFNTRCEESAMPFVLKACLFGVPQTPRAYGLLERVLKDRKLEQARLLKGHPPSLAE